MKSSKKWFWTFLITFLILLVAAGAVTVIIDPFFHYHKPIASLSYPIANQRYQNDGIARHFDYDAIITGTSMTENFKASQMNEEFGVNSIKVCYQGGNFKEMNDALTRAMDRHPGIKVVIRGLDLYNIDADKDVLRDDMGVYPDYLYDDNPFNDVKYVFNKDVLLNNDTAVISQTKSGISTTNFDEYSNWMSQYQFGKEAVLNFYTHTPKAEVTLKMTDEDRERVRANIKQNVTDLADEYPETQFYYFYPPYSIYFWDVQNSAGDIEKLIDEERFATQLILEHPNIHLYGFLDEREMMCDAENYKDTNHYSEDINARIMSWMHDGVHQLTKDNYEDYYRRAKEFLCNYDYESLFK